MEKVVARKAGASAAIEAAIDIMHIGAGIPPELSTAKVNGFIQRSEKKKNPLAFCRDLALT